MKNATVEGDRKRRCRLMGVGGYRFLRLVVRRVTRLGAVLG